MYIDIHSHLNLEPLWENRAAVIAAMREKNVSTITVGTGITTSQRAIQIADETNWWATVGVHPIHVDEEDFDQWAGHPASLDASQGMGLAQHPSVVAIGECGFDYYHRDDNKPLQEKFFRNQIELAQTVGKPLMIHARPHKKSMDAYHDVLDLLLSYGAARPYAHFHFFSGDTETARRILDAGYSVSVDGPITFTRDYDDMIRFVPLDRIMCETDSPYAAPIPYRGEIAMPWMVIQVYQQLAQLHGMVVDEIIPIIANNVQKVFGIPDKTA